MTAPDRLEASTSGSTADIGWRLIPRCPVLLRPRVASFLSMTVRRGREAVRRICEAGRDARCRLRTGRPRGVPVNFVHPPIPCSKGCSQAARRVHGYLYGLSLAYEEVRPRAMTIANALSYSKSTVHNALGELRRAELLKTRARCGRDHRRVANEYVVVLSGPSPIPDSRRGPVGVEKGKHRVENTRSCFSKSPKRDLGTTITDTDNAQPLGTVSPTSVEVTASPRHPSPASPTVQGLAHAVGLDLTDDLREALGSRLETLCKVVAEEEDALKHPEVLRIACEALLMKRPSLRNPLGYFRNVLRTQLREIEALEEELLELEEAHRQASMYEDPNQQDLERSIATLRSKIGHRDSGGVTPPVARTTAPFAEAKPKEEPRMIRPRSAENRGEVQATNPTEHRRGQEQRASAAPESIEGVLHRLKLTNPKIAQITEEALSLTPRDDTVPV